jgi:hypothetical protein
LNRPFRSVGELGYVFRGTPWRDIDFLHENSPDAGLLDLFCIGEETDASGNSVTPSTATIAAGGGAPVVAGRVNLNRAGVDVVTALLMGSSREDGAAAMTYTEANNLAKVFVKAVDGTAPQNGFQPMVSLSELVSQPKAGTTGSTTGIINKLSGIFSNSEDRSIKDRRQVVTRALTSGTTVRSWNFMLDLVVQSGRLPSSASDLNQFVSTGERRYWVHFAVDRITGTLLDVQWERVAQ